jgi:hypothetical protein
LVYKVEIILEGVLGFVFARDVSAVAHNSFDYATGLLGCVDTEFHLRDAQFHIRIISR